MNLKHLPKTKIVCTLGPTSSTKEMIEKLVDAGMNVARLNFSHGEHLTHAANINLIRQISQEKNTHIAILQDLQGPKIRTGKLKNGGVTLTKGQKITLTYGVEQSTDDIIPIDYKELSLDVKQGSRILLDDGLLGMKVIAIRGESVDCEVIYGGFLKSRKGVNFPDCRLSIPATTEKDIRDLLFGVAQGVDYIALSFVQTADDIVKLKSMLSSLGAQTPVITKVEMLSAVEHIDEICDVSDGIMVARGDLGVECGFATVAAYQKKIVATAIMKGKPVIVATQMLDSMIENRRPTKAEVCDVANAVYDRTDATMLSGESASGKYPELAVQTMRDILNRVDSSGTLRPLLSLPSLSKGDPGALVDVFARTAVELTEKTQVTAVICLTLTGQIVRSIARYRPSAPIIALSPRPDILRQLTLFYGVIGLLNPVFYDADSAFSQIAKHLAKAGYAKEGDLLLITGGIPISHILPTNTLKMHRVTQDDLT